jgi:hypothetical protein
MQSRQYRGRYDSVAIGDLMPARPREPVERPGGNARTQATGSFTN